MLPLHDDMWILYKNRIPIDRVKTSIKIPEMNPLGIQYLRFWREQKKRCIQGMWVSNDEGEFKFVSGPLYLYVNHWRIKLNEKNARSKTKTLGIPFLRDLEWLRSFVFEEARGFSGFQEDDEYTSHILMKDSHPDNDPELFET